MRFHVFLAIAIAGSGLAAMPLAAQSSSPTAASAAQTPLETRADQVVALINGELAPEALFSQSFLAALPAPQIMEFTASLTAQFGAATQVTLLAPRDGTRAALEIRFERGLAKGGIAIEPADDNRVSELVFTSVDSLAPLGDTPEKIKGGDPARIERWRSGDGPTRSAILEEVARDPMTIEDISAAFAAGPKALDTEYFASPADIAKLFAQMRAAADPEAFAIMAIHTLATPAIAANWDYIGFKGGSEPGVINLTWLLRDKAGAWHVLTLGWNNPDAAVDEAKFQGIAQRILLLPR